MTARARRAESSRADQSGAVSVILVLLTPAVFGVAGLVLDGGTALAARQRTADLAEQAARAGADRIDTSRLRGTGSATLDLDATGAACSYARTMEPDVWCIAQLLDLTAGTQVQVRLRTSSRTVLLGLVGVNTLHAQAVATATGLSGIRTGTPDRPAQPTVP